MVSLGFNIGVGGLRGSSVIRKLNAGRRRRGGRRLHGVEQAGCARRPAQGRARTVPRAGSAERHRHLALAHRRRRARQSARCQGRKGEDTGEGHGIRWRGCDGGRRCCRRQLCGGSSRASCLDRRRPVRRWSAALDGLVCVSHSRSAATARGQCQRASRDGGEPRQTRRDGHPDQTPPKPRRST